MEYGHPVAPSHGDQQMVRPHAPIYDDEPRTEPGLRADEEEHHEKKPVLKKVKDKVKKIKDTITKKSHSHGDDHDDEHYVEGEGYDEEDEEMEVEPEVDDAPQGLYGQHKPCTLDRRDEYIDMSALEAPESLRTRTSHDPLSSRDDRPGNLTSREEHVPLGGLQEPLVTPETALEAEPVAPLPYGSVPPTDDTNISGSKTAGPTPGNELSVSPDVLSSLQAMAISVQRESQQKGQHAGHEASNVEKKPSYTEKLSSTAAAAKDAAVSAASTVYAKVAGGTGNPVRTGPGVECEPREGASEKGSYTEKLSSTAAAAKDAVVHAASTVYGKVAGDTCSGETHDQVATPVSTGPGMEEVARGGAGEKKGTYTEKLSGTALATKDAALNAASTVYGKLAGAGTAVMGKVQPGGGTEQDKGVSVKAYLAEKLRPGEEDRALCEVISGSMKKRGEEDHKVEDKAGEEKGRILSPEVTAGQVGAKRVVGTDGAGDGGKGMVEKIKGAVSSLVGGGRESGDPVAAAEGTGGGGGGGAARERAHEEVRY